MIIPMNLVKLLRTHESHVIYQYRNHDMVGLKQIVIFVFEYSVMTTN